MKKENNRAEEETIKLTAQTCDDLFAQIKKKLNVQSIVYSDHLRGTILIQILEKDAGDTLLFTGEDVLSGKKVAILIEQAAIQELLKENSMAATTPATECIQ